MERDYRGTHLPNTGQKSLTVKEKQSVMHLMHKVWKFITPHIITEHTKYPGALCIPLASVSLSFLHPLILTLLLKMMKVWGAHSHHYTPKNPKCVMEGM